MLSNTNLEASGRYVTNQLHSYFRSMEQSYQRFNEDGKNIRNISSCDAMMMRLMIRANQHLRSSSIPCVVGNISVFPAQPGQEPPPVDFTEVNQFIQDLKESAATGGGNRAQLIVNNHGHFFVVDAKLSNGKIQCIVLDAAGDSAGRKTAEYLADICDNVFMPQRADPDISKIPRVQSDYYSCPFYSLSQASEMSKVDIYDYLNKLYQTPEGNVPNGQLNPTWDYMPPQLMVDAQVTQEKLAVFTQVFQQNDQSALSAGYRTAAEFDAKTAQQLRQVNGKVVNAGIQSTFTKIRQRTQDMVERMSPKEVAEKAADQSLKQATAPDVKQQKSWKSKVARLFKSEKTTDKAPDPKPGGPS